MYLIVSKPNCKYCDAAIKLLEENSLTYIKVDLGVLEEYSKEFKEVFSSMLKREGLKTVPQIFKLVGDFEIFEKSIKKDN